MTGDDNKLAIFENSRILDNIAIEAGGGIVASYKALSVRGSQVTGNRVVGPSTEQNIGGGLLASGSYLAITDSTIANNYVNGSGGGAAISPFQGHIARTVISNNTATLKGGGLTHLTFGDYTLSECSISNNSAGVGGGGGIYAEYWGLQDVLTIKSSTLDNNRTTGNGGAIATDISSIQVLDSTINANKADGSGGGIFVELSLIGSLEHTTVTDNTADANHDGEGTGGGVSTPSTGAVALNHTIVARNHDLSGTATDLAGNFAPPTALSAI